MVRHTEAAGLLKAVHWVHARYPLEENFLPILAVGAVLAAVVDVTSRVWSRAAAGCWFSRLTRR